MGLATPGGAVAKMPGCRCSTGPLRLAYLDQQLVSGGAAPTGTVRSGTLVRLMYWPGGGAGINNVLLTVDASDPSGATVRAAIEVPNW